MDMIENDTEYAETDHTENLTDMIENDTEEQLNSSV